jgi:hypothetical protein
MSIKASVLNLALNYTLAAVKRKKPKLIFFIDLRNKWKCCLKYTFLIRMSRLLLLSNIYKSEL